MQELNMMEVDEVSGGISPAMAGVAVALGSAVFGAFAAGVSAGYAIGMEIWG